MGSNTNHLKHTTMKQVYILIFKTEVNNINGFFDRKELMLHEANNFNSNLNDTIWVLTPNY